MKLSKKAVLSICLLSSILGTQLSSQAAAQVSAKKTPVLLKINDYYVLYTAPKAPYIDSNNRFMIPLRSVSELLGARIGYDAQSATATISVEEKTILFKLGSQTITVNGVETTMDTVPIVYKNAIFIPLGILMNSLNIQSKWDNINKLYSLTGEDLLQTDTVQNYEDLDVREGPVKSNDAFMPVSYRLDASHFQITIKSKNVTGADLPEGVEDVHPYFLFDQSAQFDEATRKRPEVKKDGFAEHTWTISPGIVDNKKETLKYILVKGRAFGSDSN